MCQIYVTGGKAQAGENTFPLTVPLNITVHGGVFMTGVLHPLKGKSCFRMLLELFLAAHLETVSIFILGYTFLFTIILRRVILDMWM